LKQGEFVVHVVDPDQAIAEGLATLLDTYGIQVRSYPNAEAFLDLWPHMNAERCCLLVEADLPGLSGPALVQQLLDDCADLPVLLLISTSSPELIEVARSSGRIGVIEKPFVDGVLIDQLLRLEHRPSATV
jgi:two-component system CheB/CheR fusion protein